jgi:hypothetical protein
MARAMPYARALALDENMRRIESRHCETMITARLRLRSCTSNYAFEPGFHNRRLAFARRTKLTRPEAKLYFVKSTNAMAGAVARTVTVT